MNNTKIKSYINTINNSYVNIWGTPLNNVSNTLFNNEDDTSTSIINPNIKFKIMFNIGNFVLNNLSIVNDQIHNNISFNYNIYYYMKRNQFPYNIKSTILNTLKGLI